MFKTTGFPELCDSNNCLLIAGIYLKDITKFTSCISNKNRRLFTFSSSGGDEEPKVVVVRMLKQDNNENNELKEPKIMEGCTQETGGSGNANALHGTNNAIRRSGTDTTVTKTVPAGGTVHRERSSALVPSKVKIVESRVTRLESAPFPKFSNYHFPDNSIPISGYTTFQQIECYNIDYFQLTQCISNAKTIANQLKDQRTRVCEGSTSEGPFPIYGDVPLMKDLMASLTLKYCDYIPIASTKTNLPLTVSP